ncbi:MAG: hypothetical protein RIR70_959 [Pseudomonadota bacterium]
MIFKQVQDDSPQERDIECCIAQADQAGGISRDLMQGTQPLRHPGRKAGVQSLWREHLEHAPYRVMARDAIAKPQVLTQPVFLHASPVFDIISPARTPMTPHSDSTRISSGSSSVRPSTRGSSSPRHSFINPSIAFFSAVSSLKNPRVKTISNLFKPKNRSWARWSACFLGCLARRDNAEWSFHSRRSNTARRPKKQAIRRAAISPKW